MRPELNGFSFFAGAAFSVLGLFAAVGIVFTVWLVLDWWTERRKLARRNQLAREIDDLENRRQALGLKTPPRLESLPPMKRAHRE